MQIDERSALLCELEKKLHCPEIRVPSDQVAGLLADELFEFGASGSVWTPQQVIEGLPQDHKTQRVCNVDSQILLRPLARRMCRSGYVSWYSKYSILSKGTPLPPQLDPDAVQRAMANGLSSRDADPLFGIDEYILKLCDQSAWDVRRFVLAITSKVRLWPKLAVSYDAGRKK